MYIKKYVLYNNELSIENIICIEDTEKEIKDRYQMATFYRQLTGKENTLQMALVELSEEELEMLYKD